MNETLAITREDVIEELAEQFIRGYTDVAELDTFVKGVLLFGWNYKPYYEMTNAELLAEWDYAVNDDGEYPITIVEDRD